MSTDDSPYGWGERVFGPPTGTFDPDWAASALRDQRPDLDHAMSVRLMTTAWDLLCGNDLRDEALADAIAERADLDDDLAAAVADVAGEVARLYLDRGGS